MDPLRTLWGGVLGVVSALSSSNAYPPPLFCYSTLLYFCDSTILHVLKVDRIAYHFLLIFFLHRSQLESFGPDPYLNGILFGLTVEGLVESGIVVGGKVRVFAIFSQPSTCIGNR